MAHSDRVHAKVSDYVERNHAKDDKWTHWRIVLTRDSYSNRSMIRVTVKFYLARRARKNHRVTGKKCQIFHEVYLGNVDIPEEQDRFRIPDDGSSPEFRKQMEKELWNVLLRDNLWCNGYQPVNTAELSRCIRESCLKDAEEEEQKASSPST